MTTTRFDQRPGPYGRCKTCDITFDSPAESAQHRRATFDDAISRGEHSGHTTIATNATRPERIQWHIGTIVEDKLREYGDLEGRELIMNEETSAWITLDITRDITNGDYTLEEARSALDALHETEVLANLDDVFDEGDTND